MDQTVKICGLSTPETLDAALDAGADLVGFVRFARSPRHVQLDLGRQLSGRAKGKALRAVLLVDPDDAAIEEAVDAFDPDLLQLHGAETPERVAAIRRRFGRPILKAIGIAEPSDLLGIAAFEAADQFLLDAKPPKTAAALPGGNGLPFDWRLLAGLDPDLRFMLSGGLDPDNVAAAIGLTGARAVDVSSGVESRPGEKDPARIEAFLRNARAGFAAAQSKDKVA